MSHRRLFECYIGIDYSGAKTPTSRLKGLQVFMATSRRSCRQVDTPAGNVYNWSRKEMAYWCAKQLSSKQPTIIGIDHGFSFPITYMDRYRLRNWDQFLEDFCRHWPTDGDRTSVDALRKENLRTGQPSELRLTEKWTSSTKSVFQFDIQGSVAKSTHSGIPWLRFLRNDPGLKSRLHFWPFDDFEVPKGLSVLAEAYPSILRRRYARIHKSIDQHDAMSIAMWLKEMDSRGVLHHYFNPPLSHRERRQGLLEGWILGVY
jgi:hypothetical protein